jgi:hypothetical protein
MKKIPYIIQYPADFGGCGFWRMVWPQLVMNMKRLATVNHSQIFIRDFLHYNDATAVHIQRQGKQSQLEFFKKLHHIKKRLKFRLIYDSDDIVFHEDIPDYNFAKAGLEKDGDFAKEIMEICDEVTVTTPFLRDYYLKKTAQKNITVIPNYLPHIWMGHYFSEELILRNYRLHKKKPRILYSASANHFFNPRGGESIADDFTHVKEALMANIDKFQLVLVGGRPDALAHEIDRGLVEYHPWQTTDEYPRFLANLQINMCIAPLIENDFNRAKSDLKFLEATALGLPIACQDMSTYAIAPVRFKTGEDLIKKLKETLESEETFLAASRRARGLIEQRWLERPENIGKYLDVYCHPYGDPMRKYI